MSEVTSKDSKVKLNQATRCLLGCLTKFTFYFLQLILNVRVNNREHWQFLFREVYYNHDSQNSFSVYPDSRTSKMVNHGITKIPLPPPPPIWLNPQTPKMKFILMKSWLATWVNLVHLGFPTFSCPTRKSPLFGHHSSLFGQDGWTWPCSFLLFYLPWTWIYTWTISNHLDQMHIYIGLCLHVWLVHFTLESSR